MHAFEIGKTYIVYSRDSYAHFRAKCIARTAKRVKFEASEQGARFHLPTFTSGGWRGRGVRNLAYEGPLHQNGRIVCQRPSRGAALKLSKILRANRQQL